MSEVWCLMLPVWNRKLPQLDAPYTRALRGVSSALEGPSPITQEGPIMPIIFCIHFLPFCPACYRSGHGLLMSLKPLLFFLLVFGCDGLFIWFYGSKRIPFYKKIPKTRFKSFSFHFIQQIDNNEPGSFLV